MTRRDYLKLYLTALPIFLAIDLLWLGVVAKSFYRDHLGALMRADVDGAPAAAFYMIFVVGIVVLVVGPALARRSLGVALRLGALLGLVTYAAYDLTNLAILEGFPATMALVDLAWGTVLCASVGSLTYLLGRRWTAVPS